MREASERLMTLLRGERIADPPLFEPWFAMGDLLNRRYDGEYLTMADQLGHAAVPIGGLQTDVEFIDAAEQRTDAGAYYEGGLLRDPEQLRERPEPDYDAQVEPLLDYRKRCAEAGTACWLIIGWCFDRIAASMGLEQFAMDCYDRPAFIHEAMNWVEQRNQKGIERVVSKVKPDFVLYNGDCAYKTGTMINPDMLREFTIEPTRKTVDMIHDLDIPFAFHTDG